MSPLSPSLPVRPREDQFIADLANLFRRHRVRTGSPHYLALLAPALQANNALRSDLMMLCNAISRMAESDLAAEELLQLAAKAVIGPGAAEGEIAIPAELRQVFLTSWQEYQARADSLSAEYWGDLDSGLDRRTSSLDKFALTATRKVNHKAGSSPQQEGSEITPDTRIGELTISQLRTYLDEIEQRVGRLQPYLASLQTGVPDTPPAFANSDAGETEIPVEHARSSRAFEPVVDASAKGPENRSTAEKVIPEAAFPEAPAPDPAGRKQTPQTSPSARKNKYQKRETPGSLSLREVFPSEETASADPGKPQMFRSVSELESASSHRLLWVAAGLALLAPAAYYGEAYVYPAPAPMPLSAPEPPRYSPPQPVSPVSAPITLPSPAALRPAAHPTPRLLPKEVHMEAQAARSEER